VISDTINSQLTIIDAEIVRGVPRPALQDSPDILDMSGIGCVSYRVLSTQHRYATLGGHGIQHIGERLHIGDGGGQYLVSI
jgi:hypothetical protein